MGSLPVVVIYPGIQIGLQLIQRQIELLAERDLVKLLQNGFVETLANAIGLRMPYLGFGVLNVVQCQVELVTPPPGKALR